MKKIILSLSFLVVLMGTVSLNFFKDSIGINAAMAQGTGSESNLIVLPGNSGSSGSSGATVEHKYQIPKTITTVTVTSVSTAGNSIGGGVSGFGFGVSASYDASKDVTTVVTTSTSVMTIQCCKTGSTSSCSDYENC